ncbi:MAG TPA: hypothetical protein PK878_04785 [bacterium]|nr:hypothetical protein [bacterium]HOL92769.1 hypothetical protein [bacterium]HPO99017.1 hypothetical protein [bacterium]
MDIWTAATYLLFSLAIVTGLNACWRSTLPFPQRVFWSFMIVGFPLGGSLAFALLARPSRDNLL